LVFKEFVVDGSCMRMVWSGQIDLATKMVDLTVLVAPMKTADSIIRQLPVVRELLNGSLISIPVKVTGPLSDPTVVPLSPSAVGTEVFKYMLKTFQLPFKMFQPLLGQQQAAEAR
ncbi:MAG: AsmA-like C-terminal domain-containing protein, partial [Acidobacteriota bacterium]